LIKRRTYLGCLLLLGLMTGFLMSQTAGENEIKNLQINQLEDKLVVLIESEIGIIYESFVLYSPNRLVFDLMNVEKSSLEPEYDVNKFGIAKIRTGINRPSVLRIVFDITQEYPLYKIDEVENGLEITFWPESMEIEKREPKVKEEIKEEVKKPEPEPVKVEKKAPEIKPEVKKEAEIAAMKPSEEKKFTVGIMSGLYFVQDNVFKEIYGNSSLAFGAEYSFAPFQTIKGLDFWLGFNSMQDTGKTTFLEEDLKFRMMHFSFSIRYLFYLKRFSPFIGPGIDYITYKETYPEGSPVESIEGSTLGFHIQAGSYFHITDSLSTNLFIKYNIAETTTSEDVEVSLGGFHLGIGLIYRFNL